VIVVLVGIDVLLGVPDLGHRHAHGLELLGGQQVDEVAADALDVGGRDVDDAATTLASRAGSPCG